MSAVDGLRFEPPPECDVVTHCEGRAGLDCDLSCVWRCEHNVPMDDECATCDDELAEARAAGATTPHEIGLYFKGKAAATTTTKGDQHQ